VKSRGDVAIVGRCGAADKRQIRVAANSFKEMDALQIAKVPQEAWDEIAAASQFDLVVVYLAPFPLQSRIMDIVRPGGVIRAAFDIHLSSDEHWDCNWKWWSSEMPGWGTAWHYVRVEGRRED
jgi:hypothetical protein